MRLLHKLLLLVFCAGLIPIIPSGFFLFYYRAQAKDNVLTLQQSVVKMIALMVDGEFSSLSERFENMRLIKSGEISSSVFYEMLEDNPDFLFLSITDIYGDNLISGGEPEFTRLFNLNNSSRIELIKKCISENKPFVGDFDTLYNIPVILMVYPLSDNHFAFVAVNMRDMAEKLENKILGENDAVILADRQGNSLVFSQYTEKFPKEDIVEMIKSGKSFNYAGDSHYVGTSSKIKDFDVYVIGIQNAVTSLSGINKITWLMAFMVLAVATTLYIAALIFAGKVEKPLDALLDAAKRISQEDFKIKIIEKPVFKELSDLTNAFNMMMKELDRYHDIHLEQIFEEKHKLELLVSLISDAIIFCNFSGELLYANKTAMDIITQGRGDLSNEQIRRKISDIIKNNASSDNKEMAVNFKNGIKHYSVNVTSVESKTEIPSVLITLHDITPETELRKVKEDFFNSAAHDLRAPLLSMQGFIRLLSFDVKKGSKQADYLENVERSGNRLYKLIENMLDFSRLDSGSFNINKQNFVLSELLNDTEESFKPVFNEKNISFVLGNKIKSDAVLDADINLIRRVLDNLISNAMKFTPKGGKVSLTVSSENGKTLFEVKDTGIGIPKEDLNGVFTRYKQLSNAPAGGFGLGLAICKKIVELHGGRIWAESGDGGIFKFII